MQKKTLDKLNRPAQDLRISVIDRCNFRCTYCMPEDTSLKKYSFIQPDDWLNFDEIIRVANAFTKLGVSKIRITGGEPLLRPNLPELISRLSENTNIKDLALTTNGALLKKYVKDLKKAGLSRLTVSMDALDEDMFFQMTGKKGKVNDVLEGIELAQKEGFSPIKVNVVIKRHVNENEIINLVDYFKGTPHVLRFIEYMDVGNCNHWDKSHVVTLKEIIARINEKYSVEPVDPNYYGEVAKRYRFKDGGGEIGLISSVSQPFCRDCTRARLSCDGKIFTCLFAHKGHDLRPTLNMQDDNELQKLIKNIWQTREDRYSELRNEFNKSAAKTSKVEMYEIGG